MSRQLGNLALTLSVALTVACGGRTRAASGPFPARDVITREEIGRTHAVNALEAVERLRGHWLRQKGTTQLPGKGQFQEAEIQVYLDEQRLGTIDNLQRIEIAVVEYIRFVPPAEASARWGFGHGAGAIVVSTHPLQD